MKDFNNKLTRSLDWDEMQACIEAAKILSKAFKRNIFQIHVTPDNMNPSDVHGVAFSFDRYSDADYKH